MSAGARLRGQPLVALLALLLGWVAGRAASWEPPVEPARAALAQALPPDEMGFPPAVSEVSGPQSVPGLAPAWPGAAYGAAYPAAAAYGCCVPGGRAVVLQPLMVADPGGRSQPRLVMRPAMAGDGGGPVWQLAPGIALPPGRPDFADSDAPVRRFFAPDLPAAGPAPAPSAGAAAQVRPKRWSADSWALVRRDQGGSLSPGVLPATYGASQAGAVLRYRLSLAGRHAPTAYMRTTSTLGQIRESTAAIGLSARPVPSIPMVAAIEGRLTDQAGLRRVQPAAFAYTELAPLALPARLRAELYAQAGYVAGTFATAFADGQVRVDRGALRVKSVDVRLGGGLWGGAQNGAARLDAGPGATVAFPLGKGRFGRAALDWRFRVAGDALPGSGPAVTLSAGF